MAQACAVKSIRIRSPFFDKQCEITPPAIGNAGDCFAANRFAWSCCFSGAPMGTKVTGGSNSWRGLSSADLAMVVQIQSNIANLRRPVVSLDAQICLSYAGDE